MTNAHRLRGLATVAVLAVVLGAVLSGCAAQEPSAAPTTNPSPSIRIPAPPKGLNAEGVAAWERWKEQGLTDYTYLLSVGCFCPALMGVPVTVKGSSVIDVDGKRYDADRSVIGFADTQPTIDGLFVELGQALEDADDVTVKYDKTTGVPSSIAIDWIKNAVDDEISYSADNVKPVS
ncbi:MAG TPA: DUF6174 domain-containing protein [Actinomycetes bacterium]|nr:DUF6174 domain-containing protein [Actinomycetes bacterium]